MRYAQIIDENESWGGCKHAGLFVFVQMPVTKDATIFIGTVIDF
jgi:hypothetical protein